MAEYIERDKALNVCEMHYQHCISMQDWRGDTISWNIGADIKTIPAANVVEVKHGKWIEKEIAAIYVESVLPMFSSRNFIVSSLTFRPLIHFYLIFVYSIKE